MLTSEFQKYSMLDTNFKKNANDPFKENSRMLNMYKKAFDFFMSDTDLTSLF